MNSDKIKEVENQLDELFLELRKLAEIKLTNISINSRYIPENFLDLADTRLAKAIVDSVCRKRIYAPLPQNREGYEVIHEK